MKKEIIRFIKKKINKYNLVLNINKDFTKKQKKVLIVYINSNFISKYDNVYHSQIYEMTQIVKVFIDRDYDIDVINCHESDAINLIEDVKYNLIFGLGDVFYEMALKNPNAKKILYLTENHPEFSYKKELERIKYYKERNGQNVSVISRTNLYFKKEHFKVVDYVIAMGNTDELIKDKIKFFSINPTGLINNEFNINYNNIDFSKKNFLWFGSNGAVHKGLDIVYEIFSNRDDVNLYICGLNKKERKILKIKEKKNIKILGRVDVNTEEFNKLAKEVCWMIYPSCSEAMSTSVLTCMLHGIIPIVIRENGFKKLLNNCIYLDDFKIEYIDEYITKLLSLDNNEIRLLKKRVYQFAHEEFTIEKFSNNFNAIIRNLNL